MKLDFVRGHMGGNLIILLRGEQIPAGTELETAVKLMGPNYLHAHEAGILYPGSRPGEIEVKIAEPSVPCFISACGGFTQVLGAALVETELGSYFGIDINRKPVEVMLLTGCGPTELKIDTDGQKVLRIKTDMDCFVRECYERGVGAFSYGELKYMRAGKFLVINADRFTAAYPGLDFVNWNQKTRDILQTIQHDFMERTGEIEPNVTLYDWHPEQGGDLRVVFPHYVQDDFFEPSCGTGSVALGIAVLAAGELSHLKPAESGWLTLKIESGGGIELGGPDITSLEIKAGTEWVKTAFFSHSRVEITSIGTTMLD
ncbi:MAG: hypothetical protein FJ152_01490 [Firmicutes bacterium]|nr:hypothetical protein [Bacillota bacterium]